MQWIDGNDCENNYSATQIPLKLMPSISIEESLSILSYTSSTTASQSPNSTVEHNLAKSMNLSRPPSPISFAKESPLMQHRSLLHQTDS